MPRAAEAVARLDDHVVVDAGLVELDRRADAGEAGADDQDLVVGNVGVHEVIVCGLGGA